MTLLIVLKLFIIVALLSILLASYFHTKETKNMERRLGIELPRKLRAFMNFHVSLSLFLLILFSVLFIF